MGKDKGWDYLNSDDVNETFNSGDEDGSWGYKNDDGSGSYYGADGSWGYQNEDGSGSYYGADGSWGYKNADGSASYYGADGSWGYKNADGSGSYYGEDGSWGYKNEDGSGSYYESDNSCTYYDSDDDDEDDDGDSSDGIGLAAGLAGLALGLGAAAYAKHKVEEAEEERKEEERRREEERIRAEKRAAKQYEKKLRKKRMKALFFNKKNLQIDFSTSDLIGKNYERVLCILKETGFNKYKAIPVKDVYIDNNFRVGEVAQVVINGQSWIDIGTMVPYDAEIIVTYHMKREFAFPYSSRQMIKRDFDKLAQEILNVGFTEVYTLPLNDLKTGWIKKDRAVQQVVVAGRESIKKGVILEHDVKITIQYHSFGKKNSGIT